MGKRTADAGASFKRRQACALHRYGRSSHCLAPGTSGWVCASGCCKEIDHPAQEHLKHFGRLLVVEERFQALKLANREGPQDLEPKQRGRPRTRGCLLVSIVCHEMYQLSSRFLAGLGITAKASSSSTSQVHRLLRPSLPYHDQDSSA